MHHNKRIRYEKHDYEIFWTSQHARHVCSNFGQDKLHDVHHEDIAQLLEHCDGVEEENNGRCTFLNWNNQRRCVYEIHVYLVKGSRNRPGRCVVYSAYRSNKQQYLALAAAHRSR